MSEVNKAFLRAYLKNRATEPSTHASATSDARPQSNLAADRPSASRQLPSQPTQQSQMLPSGTNLRFDPSHVEPNGQVRVQSTTDLPTAPQPNLKQGVWSSLGPERGMKALDRNSNPAIVRNGINAIPAHATQTSPKTQSPKTQAASNQPTSVNVAYTPVMFVDGLAGHSSSQRLPGSRPSERALAEMTEPIAIGTGTTAPPPSITSERLSSPQTHTRINPATPPASSNVAPAFPNEIKRIRRFDSAEKKPLDRAALAGAIHSKEPVLAEQLPLRVAFNPSWEVDQFFWPEVVKYIETSHSDAFQQIGKHLSLANRDGLKVMSITSGERGVGRSTVAMHMARCAASAGLRVALLDGDTFCPSLIDQLRLDVQQGWQDCLFENVPLHDIAIHSIADHITLFPLTSAISTQQVQANLHRMAKLVRRISTAFDLVLIDGNRLNLEQRSLVGVAQENVVDAAIIVMDTELSIKEKIDSAVSILQGMGISSIGLVENFQS